jgi:Holliday junction resolvasome RuvABC endonuclease subunit
MSGCLGIDFGTTLGWALLDGNGNLSSGYISFKPSRFEGGGMRFLRFRRWLEDMWELGDVRQVYFEEVRRHLGVDAAHIYGGFLAHLTGWCEERGIPYQGIPVQSIKLAVCGKGNAKKEDIVQKISSYIPYITDHNEADAIGVLISVFGMSILRKNQ